jgi:hypothetical protein
MHAHLLSLRPAKQPQNVVLLGAQVVRLQALRFVMLQPIGGEEQIEEQLLMLAFKVHPKLLLDTGHDAKLIELFSMVNILGDHSFPGPP